MQEIAGGCYSVVKVWNPGWSHPSKQHPVLGNGAPLGACERHLSVNTHSFPGHPKQKLPQPSGVLAWRSQPQGQDPHPKLPQISSDLRHSQSTLVKRSWEWLVAGEPWVAVLRCLVHARDAEIVLSAPSATFRATGWENWGKWVRVCMCMVVHMRVSVWVYDKAHK